MKDDPIVEEVRRSRAELFAECGDDLMNLLDRLREAETEHADRIWRRKQGDQREGPDRDATEAA